jgi:hypothetical protein
MVTTVHQFDAVRELLEVEALVSAQRMMPKERDDDLQEVPPPAHDVAVKMLAMVIKPSVAKHLSHSKELVKLVETLDAQRALRDRKLMSDLVSGRVASSPRPVWLPDKANREASFSVYKTDHPATELA